MKFKFLHTNHYSLLLVFSFDPLIENKQLCLQRVQLFISSPGGGGTKSTHKTSMSALQLGSSSVKSSADISTASVPTSLTP